MTPDRNAYPDSASALYGGGKRHICPICSQSFGRTEHLERHVAAHKGSRPWVCEYCRSRFSRKDVMYRHHNTCQAAHEAGFRRGAHPKKSKRRSCERCSRLKCKCDDQIPCSRCAAAGVQCQRIVHKPSPTPEEEPVEEDLTGIHLLSHHASQTPKQILSPNVIPGEFFSNSVTPSQSLPFPAPFQHDPSTTLTTADVAPFDWGLFDMNIGAIDSMDNLLPDTDEILREMFKILNHPQTGSLAAEPGAILPDTTVDDQLCDWNSLAIPMNRIDPLETHRLTINQHLLQTGAISAEDISWLSPHTVREMLYYYFRHVHRHIPIIHVPTWDISSTPSSLLLCMILMGAVYSDNPKNVSHAWRIAREAKSLIYKLDPGVTEGPHPSLDSIQAYYLWAVFSIFYVGMDESRKTRQDYIHLVDLVRNSGYFSSVSQSEDTSRTWEEWVYEEKWKRTAYCIYLLDCGRVLFFGDRPTIAPYDVRLTVPSHEHIFEARTAFEWQIAYTPPNPAEFPILLEMLLSAHVDRHPADIGVMGTFCLLHGIHVHIWTAQQYESSMGGSPGVGASLAEQRNQAISFALQKWRDGWVSSKQHTHPAQTIGLYQEKGMMWWVLAKLLHEKKGRLGQIAKWSDTERIENIMKIIKAIHLTVEKGGVKEENLSPEAVKEPTKRSGTVVETEGGLSSMTISFIMGRKAED